MDEKKIVGIVALIGAILMLFGINILGLDGEYTSTIIAIIGAIIASLTTVTIIKPKIVEEVKEKIKQENNKNDI